jgi:hypothetical protein
MVRLITPKPSPARALVVNIFLARASQLHHIAKNDVRRFRRPAPKKINRDG